MNFSYLEKAFGVASSFKGFRSTLIHTSKREAEIWEKANTQFKLMKFLVKSDYAVL